MANITRTKINTLILASVLTANIASAVGIVKIPTDATTTENAKILLSTPTLENSAYNLTETQSEGEFTITKYINNEGILSAVDYNVLFNNPLGDTSGTATSFWWSTDSADNRILTTDGTGLGDADITVNVDSQKNVRVDTSDKTESITITNSFAGITKDVTIDGEQYGGAIYNAEEKTITKISGDFVGNSLTLTTALESDNFLKGGAIANYGTITEIESNFIGNSMLSSVATATSLGGAIYNDDLGTINTISANFIENSIISNKNTYGAGIANYNGYIGSITGDFISNYLYSGGTAGGSAIFNWSSDAYIDSISGDFIGNYTEGYSGYGGVIFNFQGATINKITGDFINNTLITNTESGYGGVIYNSASTINVIEGNFINNLNSANKSAMGGAIMNSYFIGLESSEYSIKGDFIDNIAYSETSSAWGGAIYNGGTIYSIYGDFISNAVISGCSNSTSNGSALGGAICNYYNTGYIGLIEGSFVDNYASSLNASSVKGGAIYISGTMTLSANSGDIYSYGNFATANFESGVAVPVDTDDANGGFLYINGTSTVNFDIGADDNGNAYTMTIGEENGTAGYDSIASSSTSSIINKTGDGTLTVNSSMQYYTGALNVTVGTMEVNNKLGASSITIDSGATLALTVSQDYVLSYTGSLSFTNNGTLSLSASASDLLTLSESTEPKSYTYTLSAASNATSIDYGNLVLYGGILDNNIFTVSLASTVSSDDFETESVVLNGSSNILITDSATSSDVTISTSSSTSATTEAITISAVSENTSSIVEGNLIYTAISDDVSSDFTVLSSWDFDIEFADDADSVVVSFLVGEGYDLSSIYLYHTDDEGTINATESIFDYDENGYLSFYASSFSSYTAIAVPEPSTYAMIFGALALGLAMYRRRK